MKSPKIDRAANLLIASGERGVTWRDYAALTGDEHGAASGMLSRLHSRGVVARLAEKRDGYAIYVLTDHVGDRPTIAVRKRRTPDSAEVETLRLQVDRLQAELDDVREQADRMVRDAQTHVDAVINDAAGRDIAFAEGLAAGRAEVEAKMAAAIADARATGRAAGLIEADKAWQFGYDEGVKVGAAEAVKDLKRKMTAAGGEPFNKGREVGRREGEEVARRHVARVAGELFRTISESAPVRTHHSTCYKQHADCAVKSVAASLGIPVARLKSESAA